MAGAEAEVPDSDLEDSEDDKAEKELVPAVHGAKPPRIPKKRSSSAAALQDIVTHVSKLAEAMQGMQAQINGMKLQIATNPAPVVPQAPAVVPALTAGPQAVQQLPWAFPEPLAPHQLQLALPSGGRPGEGRGRARSLTLTDQTSGKEARKDNRRDAASSSNS